MNLKLHFYNEDALEWDAYVESHRDSTNYHRHGWRSVIEKSFGHSTYYLSVRDSLDEICGLLPLVHMKSPLFGNFLVSLPFFNYGGILCENEEISNFLLSGSAEILSSLGGEFMELRHSDMCLNGLETKQHKVTMILDLEKDEEAQWKSLDTKVRNQVRKAKKNNLKSISGGAELLDGFYDVFCRNMRDLGTPVYSKSFFRHILEEFPGSSRIISVHSAEDTVASGLLVWFRNRLEVPWASSVRDFRAKCPNNLLYWEAIRFAIGLGMQKFDFGRSTPGEGTYRFKKQWGAMPVSLHWQYVMGAGNALPEINPKNPKYQAAIKVWKKLPVRVTRTLGPSIARSIP